MIEQDAVAGFDGLSAVARDETGVAIGAAVISRRGLPGERQRLNFVHEVGHIVPKIIVDDLSEEDVAFRFGAAFLAPAAVIRREVGRHRTSVGWDELLMLKGALGMSVQALLYRLKTLEIISQEHYSDWFRFLSMAGFRKAEPNELPAEKPEWLRRNVLRAWAEGLISVAHAERLIDEPLKGVEVSPLHLSHRRWSNLTPEERAALLAQGAQRAAEFYSVNAPAVDWATQPLPELLDNSENNIELQTEETEIALNNYYLYEYRSLLARFSTSPFKIRLQGEPCPKSFCLAPLPRPSYPKETRAP